nr:TonB-dependent heme receptor A like [Ipomoea batatas]
MALNNGLRSCTSKLLTSTESLLPISVSRGIYSTGMKRMGGTHGQGHVEPFYFHAKNTYNLDRMKHQKLKITLGGGAKPVIFRREEASNKVSTNGVGLGSSTVGLGASASSPISQLEALTFSVQVGSEVVLFQWLETGTRVSSQFVEARRPNHWFAFSGEKAKPLVHLFRREGEPVVAFSGKKASKIWVDFLPEKATTIVAFSS